jgi:hypothetical protein
MADPSNTLLDPLDAALPLIETVIKPASASASASPLFDCAASFSANHMVRQTILITNITN